MKIKDEIIKYKNGLPFAAELCNISRQIPHRHVSELELVYCIEGSVRLIAADQDYVLTSGQIHSIDFRDVHYLTSDEYNAVIIFHLDLSYFTNWEHLKYVYFACESNHCFPYQEPAMREIKDIVLSLSYLYFTGTTYNDRDYRVPVNKMLDILLQYFNWFNYENQDHHINQELYDRFTRILIYIIENYKEKITVSELAVREHINKNYFSQFISKTVFSSFSNMVKYIRCYEAEDLMLNTDMSISDIAFDCGFSDPKYFYSAFKELWGMTPTEHRERYKKHIAEAMIDKKNATLPDVAAASIIKEYITRWHITKSFIDD